MHYSRCRVLVTCATAAITTGVEAQLRLVQSNVVYATVGGRSLLLDLYVPPFASPSGPGPYPLVVYIHGGGWQGGDKAPLPSPITRLGPLGVAVASINYRLTSQAGQWGAEPVIWPAQIHDVKGAVRFLRSRASQYNVDPARIGTWGTSAGGHLAAVLATSSGVAALEGTVGGNLAFSSSVIVACDYYGPTDLLQMQPDVTIPPGSTIDHDAPGSFSSRLIGFNQPGQGLGVLRANQNNPNPPYPALIALVTSVRPMSYVDPADPPHFIAHGTADTTVPVNQSQRLANALQAAGVVHDYRAVVGFPHSNVGTGTDAAAAAFLADHLVPASLCYPNCDGGTLNPVLNPADFICFLNRFRASDPRANCDGTTAPPVLTPADLVCFLNAFRLGCP